MFGINGDSSKESLFLVKMNLENLRGWMEI